MYEFGEEELLAIGKLIEKKSFFRYPAIDDGECNLFEKEFAEYLGLPYSTIMSSGTNALVSALVALEVGPGDEVIVPAYTYVATAAAVVLVGATPVIANIDEKLGIDPKDIERNITKKTKVIIPVHMDGLCANLEEIISVADIHGIAVLEDCAQAMGGTFKGRSLGTWGKMGIFSLNESKNLTCGEGGIVVTKDLGLHHRAFSAHDLAARYNPTNIKTMPAFPNIIALAGRVSEIQGAIMRVQLRRLEGILSKLRQRRDIMSETLGNLTHGKVNLGHDQEGSCGSSLHIRFSDPLFTITALETLLKCGIKVSHPSGRPAHVAWKWMGITPADKMAELNQELRPSYSILTSTLKIDVPYEKSLDEVRAWSQEIVLAINGV